MIGWGNYVLHNSPFYSISILKEKPEPKVIRVSRSLYELSKSAELWTPPEFKDNYGVTKSDDVNT
jgi:hypothetical protein